MNETLTFNGINSADYGVFISGSGTFNAPERVVEMVTVPGRNGAIAMDEGRFENITVEYPAFIAGATQSEFSAKLSSYRNVILSAVGYQRLEDDFHPDEYRLGVYRSGLDVDPHIYNRAGEFTLSFDCKPQRFLKSGETVATLSASGSVTNPTRFPSKPLLRVYGSGTVTMNGYAIGISSGASAGTYIDLDTFEAYTVTGGTVTPRNGVVTIGNQTPVLSPGENTVTLGSGITKVDITPRWWSV